MLGWGGGGGGVKTPRPTAKKMQVFVGKKLNILKCKNMQKTPETCSFPSQADIFFITKSSFSETYTFWFICPLRHRDGVKGLF